MTENLDVARKEEYLLFREDMTQILNLVNLLNKKYVKSEPESYFYLKKLRNTLDNFNEKYEGVYAAVKKTNLLVYLKFFLKKESINNVFDEFIKEDSFLKQRIFNNKASLQREFNSDKNIHSNISEILALKKNKNLNMIELIYRDETLKDSNSPEFRLLVSHVMCQKINKKKDIRQKEED